MNPRSSFLLRVAVFLCSSSSLSFLPRADNICSVLLLLLLLLLLSTSQASCLSLPCSLALFPSFPSPPFPKIAGGFYFHRSHGRSSISHKREREREVVVVTLLCAWPSQERQNMLKDTHLKIRLSFLGSIFLIYIPLFLQPFSKHFDSCSFSSARKKLLLAKFVSESFPFLFSFVRSSRTHL